MMSNPLAFLLCIAAVATAIFHSSKSAHKLRQHSTCSFRCGRNKLLMTLDNPIDSYINGAKAFSAALVLTSRAFLMNAEMASTISLPPETTLQSIEKDYFVKNQSPGWELARQKRTAAIKAMQEKGMLQIDTDDLGNQFLKLPWIPDRRVPYKSLSISQRLTNEVCAGAFGEISKDALLHAVDTAKTRRQAAKKKQTMQTGSDLTTNATDSLAGDASSMNATSPSFSLSSIKDLYAGFPVVLMTSIPQGGAFFLVKKGFIEFFNVFAPNIPKLISATVPIGFAVMAYWGFRTPAEVIKTQVQTGMSPNVKEAFDVAMARSTNGYLGLWKYYPIMLWLDVPFQIINFILYGALSDAVLNAGYETSVWTRLFCGVTCGMISAAATCPVDVCKTRIISRDKAATAAATAGAGVVSTTSVGSTSAATVVDVTATESSSMAVATTTTEDELVLVGVPAAAAAAAARKKAVAMVGAGVGAGSGDSGLIDDNTVFTSTPSLAPASTPVVHSSNQVSHAEEQQQQQQLPPGSAHQHHQTEMGAVTSPAATNSNPNNVPQEILKIAREEGVGTLFLGIGQRLLYVGLANGIRLAAYGTSRMDLMMRSLDDL